MALNKNNKVEKISLVIIKAELKSELKDELKIKFRNGLEESTS